MLVRKPIKLATQINLMYNIASVETKKVADELIYIGLVKCHKVQKRGSIYLAKKTNINHKDSNKNASYFTNSYYSVP